MIKGEETEKWTKKNVSGRLERSDMCIGVTEVRPPVLSAVPPRILQKDIQKNGR